MTRTFTPIFLALLLAACAGSQTVSPQLVGSCEGCEAVFEYGNRTLNEVDTLPYFHEGDTQIKVSGTIYEMDGTTPAAGVIMYLYHTDQNGIYVTKGDETGWAKRHGYIRGWVKTDSEGQYTFYTAKPGAYPGRTEPAHIHPVILEPNGKYYWINDYLFEGDPLLTEEDINPVAPRGGTKGILVLKKQGNLWVGTRDLVLGKHIPGYSN